MSATHNLPRRRGDPSDTIEERLFGVWRLVSTEQRMADGTSRPSRKFGPDGVGFLFYSYPNHMCANVGGPASRTLEIGRRPCRGRASDDFRSFQCLLRRI